jgi:hypothetical protein
MLCFDILLRQQIKIRAKRTAAPLVCSFFVNHLLLLLMVQTRVCFLLFTKNKDICTPSPFQRFKQRKHVNKRLNEQIKERKRLNCRKQTKSKPNFDTMATCACLFKVLLSLSFSLLLIVRVQWCRVALLMFVRIRVVGLL